MNLRSILALAALSTISAAALAAEPPSKPAKEGLCAACHGPKGAKPIMDAYPKLAGQNAAYLESSLKAYRSGNRSGGMAAVMVGQAKALTDDEIKALSAYYAAQ